MTRSWMIAILLMGTICGVTEARGRNRAVRSRGRSYQYQYPVRYNMGAPQYVAPQYATPQVPTPQSDMNSSRPIQQVSYHSNSSNSTGQGHSMQAWAEEEVRMMAARGTCGHIRGAPAGYFVGVGCGMTCMGSGTLVAEASYQGKMVRVWKR